MPILDQRSSAIFIFDDRADFPAIGNPRALYTINGTAELFKWDGTLDDYVLLSGMGGLNFRGTINLPADFPTTAGVENGDFYLIGTNVTDNDPSRTNTGLSFTVGNTILWNGTTWNIQANLAVNTLENISSDTIPIMNNAGTAFQDSPFSFDQTNNRIISTASIEVPNSSIFISENLALQGSGNIISLLDITNNNRNFFPDYRLGVDGTEIPGYNQYGAEVEFVISDVSDEISPTTSSSFSMISGNNLLVGTSTILPAETASNVSIIIRYGGLNGLIIGRETVDFVDGVELAIPSAPGYNVIQGQEFTGQIVGARVRGTTIDGTFVPFSRLTLRVATPRSLVTDENVNETVEDIIGSKVIAGDNVSVVYDDTTGDTTISTTSAPNINMVSINNFTINIDSRVDLNTDLNIARTVTYDVVNADQIQTINLEVTAGDNKALLVPTSDVSQSESVTLSGIDTSSQTMLSFMISGTDMAGNSFQSSVYRVDVRNIIPAESSYFGKHLAAQTPANVALGTLTLRQIRAGDTFNFDFLLDNTDVALALIPDDLQIASILDRTFNQEILNEFVFREDERTEGGQSYDSYVHQNNSGVTGTLSTTITISSK